MSQSSSTPSSTAALARSRQTKALSSVDAENEAAIQQAGYVASVSYAEECDPDDPSCDYRPGVVWSQSPDAGEQREQGSTVTIVVNP